MEIFKPNIDNKWSQQELPFSVNEHCVVKYENYIIVTGGQTLETNRHTYYFPQDPDAETTISWHETKV